MTPELLASKLRAVAAEYPLGIVLYHRASGQRMVVIGCNIDMQGCVLLDCDAGSTWGKQLPGAMTSRKPATEDGDEWKNDEPEGARP